MGSLNESMVVAEKMGRKAADNARTVSKGSAVMTDTGMTGSGNARGRLVLDVFREHGEDGMRAVMKGYRTGYRNRTNELEPDQEGAA